MDNTDKTSQVEALTKLRKCLLFQRDFWKNAEKQGGNANWRNQSQLVCDQFESLFLAHGLLLTREDLPGHITASAIICSPDFKHVLLTHHRKLNRWLQLGGHCDGNPDVAESAHREAEEESGLAGFTFVPWFGEQRPPFEPLPFDFDVHGIPANSKEPAHDHYDVRYILTTEFREPKVSDESHDVKWFTIDDARRICQDESTSRQFDKLSWLRSR
jgi:8-oxo-dGTP pyrophosphatase MutT (NUDIX family)